MKKLWMLSGILLVTLHIHAQNASNGASSSPAETFANRKGTILEKRFDVVNKINQLNIQLEYISDLSNHDKIVCVRFDIELPGNASTASALLDSNETSGLINFLKYITANVIQRIPVDPNTEISITDKYNLQIGCYWQKNNGWIVYIRTEADNPSTETDVSQANIPALLKTLTLSISEIKNN